MPPLSAGVRLEFWPTRMFDGVRQREPDVFLLDEARQHALVVEAKRGLLRQAEPLARQLLEEGWAARATHRGVRLHLLVVSDDPEEPAAFTEVRRLRPRLYASRMRHASWDELCAFLSSRAAKRYCDPGQRRMINDAIRVMRKYGRGRPATVTSIRRRQSPVLDKEPTDRA
jgi:hypothetical protein